MQQYNNTLMWDPYFLRSGHGFNEFWTEFLNESERDLLFVLGAGFDPRMCVGIETILEAKGRGLRDCVVIEYQDETAATYDNLVRLRNENLERLKSSLRGHGSRIDYKPLEMWTYDGSRRVRTSSYNAANVFKNLQELTHYTDIIVDISAMPRAVYFSLVGKLLYLLQKPDKSRINLHVVVSESPSLDIQISEVGVDETASYVHGFTSMQSESNAGVPQLWIPVLGESQRVQLERIHSFIMPDEICPVLPFPSRAPRRGDNLLIEYRELLFDQWLVDATDIVYVSELNPFDVYRQICQVVRRYNLALSPLGGCRTAISAQSSKLLSLGALLAAYELEQKGERKKRTGIVHIESHGYNMNQHIAKDGWDIYELWLAGECYESP